MLQSGNLGYYNVKDTILEKKTCITPKNEKTTWGCRKIHEVGINSKCKILQLYDSNANLKKVREVKTSAHSTKRRNFYGTNLLKNQNQRYECRVAFTAPYQGTLRGNASVTLSIYQTHVTLLRIPTEFRFPFSTDTFKFFTDFHGLFNEKIFIADSFNVKPQ